MPNVKLEVCVDDIAGFNAAVAGGADRIELCSALGVGGLTPTAGLIEHAANATIPVYAMIRPRAGDFNYNSTEIAAMQHEIDAIQHAGLAGVVFGVSQDNFQLDAQKLETLCKHAHGFGITLHRAIDLVPDPVEAVNMAADLGFERILTSGCKPTAIEGLETLQLMHHTAANRLTIMPGSGISLSTAPQVLAAVPTTEIHASCATEEVVSASKLTEFGFVSANKRHSTPTSVAALKEAIQL